MLVTSRVTQATERGKDLVSGDFQLTEGFGDSPMWPYISVIDSQDPTAPGTSAGAAMVKILPS